MRLSISRVILPVRQALLYRQKYRQRVLPAICVLCCLIVYIIVFILLVDNSVTDNQYLNAVDEAVLKNRVDFYEVVVDKYCSQTTSRCYSVFDRKVHTNRISAEIVERHLLVDGFSDESDTVIRLIAPKDERFDNSDTRIWLVNHSDIRVQYIAGMLVAPFLVSSLSLDMYDEGKNVLEIGLGGGNFDMNLHRFKPHVNITIVELDPVVVEVAKKWFGVKDERNHHTVVQDGIEYLKHVQSQGMKFDVIVLDACDEAIKSPCPAKSFQNIDIIKMFKLGLTSSGCLVVNILSHDLDGTKSSSREIAQLFYSVFPTCIQMRMVEEVNVILTCFSYSISNIRQQLTFYNARLKTVISYLNLDSVLDKVMLI